MSSLSTVELTLIQHWQVKKRDTHKIYTQVQEVPKLLKRSYVLYQESTLINRLCNLYATHSMAMEVVLTKADNQQDAIRILKPFPLMILRMVTPNFNSSHILHIF